MSGSNDMKKNRSEVNKQSAEQETNELNNKVEADDTMKKDLENCKADLGEWKDRFVRLNADFENFKRRMLEQQRLWVGTAQAEIFTNLLSIADDFERALTEHKKQKETAESKAWIEGFSLIYQSLLSLLNQAGVKEITEYETFNPVYHEAIMQVESPDHESGVIVEVIQKGYSFKDKVLRPAKVSVAK